MKITLYIFIAILCSAIPFEPSVAFAHPGRTDSSGGHTCRTNCPNWGLEFGEYHYHRAKALPQAKPPVKSKFGENGTGYTVPAPEYEKPSVVIPRSNRDSNILDTKSIEQPKKGFWRWLSSLFQ